MINIWPSINLDRLSKTTASRSPEDSLDLYQSYQAFSHVHMIDIQGIEREKPQATDKIFQLITRSKLPVVVGGGIRSIEAIEQYLKSGVDAIAIGNKGLSDLLWLKQITNRYPNKIYLVLNANVNEILQNEWKQKSRLTVSDIIHKVKDFKLKGIIYKDLSKDGKLLGPNIEMNKEIVGLTNLPIIAAGGIRNIEDIKLLEAVGVKACIVDRACETASFFEALPKKEVN